MEITLPSELEAAVQRGVASGRYAIAEEYLTEAVELLEQREQWSEKTLEEQQEMMASNEGGVDQPASGMSGSVRGLRTDFSCESPAWRAKPPRLFPR
jgi:Arc/MetJ-type ribon-helix-helix transcriptional regulator